MEKRTIITLALSAVLILLISVSSVLAITGSIGNSRMILRLEQGEKVERYILVKNVNDIPVTIDLFASGDLADDVVLKEDNFVLYPNEDKKAYFTITASKPGTTETKINVKFTPEEGAGIGLSSTIIVIAGEGFSSNNDGATSENVEDTNTQSPITGHLTSQGRVPTLGKELILVVSTFVLIVSLFILLIYAKVKSKKSKKKVGRSDV